MKMDVGPRADQSGDLKFERRVIDCGDLHMRTLTEHGFIMGLDRPRKPLVKLFASVLRRSPTAPIGW